MHQLVVCYRLCPWRVVFVMAKFGGQSDSATYGVCNSLFRWSVSASDC